MAGITKLYRADGLPLTYTRSNRKHTSTVPDSVAEFRRKWVSPSLLVSSASSPYTLIAPPAQQTVKADRAFVKECMAVHNFCRIGRWWPAYIFQLHATHSLRVHIKMNPLFWLYLSTRSAIININSYTKQKNHASWGNPINQSSSKPTSKKVERHLSYRLLHLFCQWKLKSKHVHPRVSAIF